MRHKNDKKMKVNYPLEMTRTECVPLESNMDAGSTSCSGSTSAAIWGLLHRRVPGHCSADKQSLSLVCEHDSYRKYICGSNKDAVPASWLWSGRAPERKI